MSTWRKSGYVLNIVAIALLAAKLVGILGNPLITGLAMLLAGTGQLLTARDEENAGKDKCQARFVCGITFLILGAVWMLLRG